MKGAEKGGGGRHRCYLRSRRSGGKGQRGSLRPSPASPQSSQTERRRPRPGRVPVPGGVGSVADAGRQRPGSWRGCMGVLRLSSVPRSLGEGSTPVSKSLSRPKGQRPAGWGVRRGHQAALIPTLAPQAAGPESRGGQYTPPRVRAVGSGVRGPGPLTDRNRESRQPSLLRRSGGVFFFNLCKFRGWGLRQKGNTSFLSTCRTPDPELYS